MFNFRQHFGWLVAGAMVLGVVGCASVPTPNFYTLDMRPSGQVHTEYRLDDVRIRAGEAVSRPEIMIRTSPTAIEYYATHRWAANLGEQLREKLKTEFAGTDGTKGIVSIEGTVLAFEQIDTEAGADAYVKLELRVSVEPDGDDFYEFERVYEVTIVAAAWTPGAVVEALSDGVEVIAVDLAADLAP